MNTVLCEDEVRSNPAHLPFLDCFVAALLAMTRFVAEPAPSVAWGLLAMTEQ
jgi:hypothetical protein